MPNSLASIGPVLISPAQPVERFGGAEFALEVSLERLQCEAAQVLGPAAGPGLGGEG